MSLRNTYSTQDSNLSLHPTSQTVAAIVCAHTLDRWDDIQQAIDSLRTQSRAADEIILSVDNNAELVTAAVAAFPDVSVVHNTGPRGVSAARNVAARSTGCALLAYLDDDAVADKAWIEHLVHWYHDDTVVGVGGTAEPAWDGRKPAWFPASFNWVVGCSHSGIANEPAPVRNFIGCNMSIRRTAWETVGGFDESIGRVGADGGGGDETDFCMRVSDAMGGVIMNDPGAVVAHRVPASRQTFGYFLKRCRSEGRSKAMISARAGADQALSEERKHLLGELPRAFGTGLLDAFRGDLSGLARSAAILAGTAATGFGYLTGLLKRSSTASNIAAQPAEDFVPTQVVVLDLADAATPSITVGSPAFVIVRRGAQLLSTERFKAAPPTPQLVSQMRAAFPVHSDPMRPPRSATRDRTMAVVIATRDRPEPLHRVLQSIAALERTPEQLIVVDNAPSNDATALLVERWNQTTSCPIRYIRCDRPGLATAHNAALPHLGTDVVAFTDDDVIVDEHWIDQLTAGFDAGDRVACVTGAIMPAELETWPQDWVESSSNFNKGFTTQLFSTANPPADPLFPFTAGSMGSGANMAFRVDWLIANCGFDEVLGVGAGALGGDDLRSFYDVVSSGHELFFTPDAIVFHHHHRTSAAIDRQAYGYGAGLGAFLTSVVVDDPAALLKMLRRGPAALRHAMMTTAPAAGSTYPAESRRAWRQRAGMLAGPVRYLRTRGSASSDN